MFEKTIALADGVYLYPNFATKQEAEELYMLAYSLFPWKGSLSKGTELLIPMRERLQNVLQGYELYNHHAFQCLIAGQDMYEHTDTPSDPNHRDEEGERWSRIEWGAILYINDDYIGGEIYYPELDISYKPNAGDLILHRSNIVHGVHVVKKGIRFAYSNFATHALEQGQL